MGWVSLATALFTFGTHLFKYLNAQDDCKKEQAKKLRRVNDALKSARKSKDTSGLEAAFAELGLGRKPPGNQ